MQDFPARRIRARFLVIDPQTVVRDGWITLTGDGTVRALGAVQTDTNKESGHFDQEVDGVVAAAMVNAHCHSEFGALAGKVPGGAGLPEWVGSLLAQARTLSPPERLHGMTEAAQRLADLGTGWIGDINNSADSGPALAAAGLRGVIFHELLDPLASNLEQVIHRADQQLLAAKKQPGLEIRRVPHTPFSCSEELLRLLLGKNNELAPISIHLAEDPAEIELLEQGTGPWLERLQAIGRPQDAAYPKQRPIAWFEQLGFLNKGLLAVHLCQATAAELQLLAQREVRTVLCPASNRHIMDCLPPVQDALNAGLQPGLGTDSPASHPDLNLRLDLALIAQHFPKVSNEQLWSMATRWGAQALGLETEAGSLWPGRAPGLLAIDCDKTEDPLQVLCREYERPARRMAGAGPPSTDD